MLIGVHRRDVKTYRDPDLTEEKAAKEKVTNIATLLGRWMATPDLVGTDGVPRALPRTGPNSFEELAKSISQDIRPRTMLDEMLRQGLIRQEGELLHLDADAFLGPADLEQKVYFFAENVGDHLAAAVDNLLALRRRGFRRRGTGCDNGHKGEGDQLFHLSLHVFV